jgi:circadian clock protein KaiB
MTRRGMYRFRLYVAGAGHNSVLAVSNLEQLCRHHLADRYQIEIIDVTRDPARALDDAILLTPTLVKLSPKPVRRLIGNLSDPQVVLDTCGLRSSGA